MSADLEKRQPQAVERQRETVFDALAALARDPSVPVDRIVSLYDLQRRAEADEAERQFNAAFARLKLPRISKKGTIDMGAKGSMKFARYEDLDDAIRHLYVAEGFSLSFVSEPTDKGIVLVAVLAHSAGHHKTSRLQLPPDAGAGRNALQALGSALTYAKRYLTCDLFNIVTVGLDDDATSGDFLSQKRVDNIEDMIQECGEQVRGPFLTFVGAKAVSEIQNGGYTAAINYLVAKRRQIAEKSK